MNILITGIPGTGKTTIGEYLVQHHGFTHFDMEVSRGEKFDQQFNTFNILEGNKVITWGFMPGTHDDIVLQFKNMGYRMIWFDGDRPSARREFIKRGTVSVDALNKQISRINKLDLAIFNPIQINTFNQNGKFRDKEEICEEIINAVCK